MIILLAMLLRTIKFIFKKRYNNIASYVNRIRMNI